MVDTRQRDCELRDCELRDCKGKATQEVRTVENKTMARLLAETADLMEIDGADSFRIRSYRRAAEAAEQTTVDLVEAAKDSARLLEIPGIGKSMAANLQAIVE